MKTGPDWQQSRERRPASEDFCHPPVYDAIPMTEMGLKAWLAKHGFGRFQP
jgi:hypothetical protein